MARIFVAVWPPSAVRAALTSIPRPDRTHLRWVPDENLHVTLRFLGQTDADTVATRLRAVRLPRATATLGPATTRLGDRILVAPVTGLDALAEAVAAATRDLGAPASARGFVGHVTLARGRDHVPSDLVGTPLDGRFPVTSVAVVSSDTRPDGARYTTLATIPTA